MQLNFKCFFWEVAFQRICLNWPPILLLLLVEPISNTDVPTSLQQWASSWSFSPSLLSSTCSSLSPTHTCKHTLNHLFMEINSGTGTTETCLGTQAQSPILARVPAQCLCVLWEMLRLWYSHFWQAEGRASWSPLYPWRSNDLPRVIEPLRGSPSWSGIQTLTSRQLVHSSSQAGNSARPGVALALQKESERRPGLHFIAVKTSRKRKKKSKAVAPNSQLTWQVQSQCCHLYSMPLLGFQEKTTLWWSGCELMRTFSTGKRQMLNPIFHTRSSNDSLSYLRCLLSYCSESKKRRLSFQTEEQAKTQMHTSRTLL